MYIGDPTLMSRNQILKLNKNYQETCPKPKSAILWTPLLIKILETLISLCTICFLAKYLRPSQTSTAILYSYFSLKGPDFLSFFYKSPPVQSSITMQQLRTLDRISSHPITLGWDIDFNILVQVLSSYCSRLVVRECSSMIFMATGLSA